MDRISTNKDVHPLLLALLLVLTLGTTPAFASGSFGEKFQDWLLGEKAEAAVRDNDSFGFGAEFECMQCHDGTAAPSAHVKAPGSPLVISGHQTIGHPIGMDYDTYAARQSREYHSRHAMDSNILFDQGRVTCISCHRLKDNTATVEYVAMTGGIEDPYRLSGTADCMSSGELTVGPRQTDLCMACHNL